MILDLIVIFVDGTRHGLGAPQRKMLLSPHRETYWSKTEVNFEKFSNFDRFFAVKILKLTANCFSYSYRGFAPGLHWGLPSPRETPWAIAPNENFRRGHWSPLQIHPSSLHF